MHEVLLIPEVVQRIIDNLRPSDPAAVVPKEMRATLLNVALTCRSFVGPALDTLWYTIDDLTVLFQLLPNFIASDGTKPGIILDNILEADVQKFDSYASRIRSYIQQSTSDIDISAFVDILKACNRSHLLPNLQHLYPKSRTLATSALVFLASSRLRVFDYTTWPWDNDQSVSPRSVLNLLRKSSPDLIVLNLRRVVMDDISLSALGALNSLEELRIQHVHTVQTITIHVEFLLNISARKTLRFLDLRGKRMEIVSLSSWSIGSSSTEFPALEGITFDCNLTMASLATFLGSTTFPVLKRSSFELYGHISDEVDHIFDRIGNVTTKHFEKLFLYHREGSPSSSTLSRIPNLSSLSLTTVGLNTSLFGSFGRPNVIAIANAWPSLLSLQLLFNEAPNIDVSILIDIAMGLPHLRDLELSVNYHLPDLADIPILSHRLRILNLTIFNFNPHRVWNVAHFMDRLFPYLELCDIGPDEVDDDDIGHKSWDDMRDVILLLRKVREDENIRRSRGDVKLPEQ